MEILRGLFVLLIFIVIQFIGSQVLGDGDDLVFVKEPQELIAEKNRHYLINCSVYSRTGRRLHYHWTKDGEPVHQQRRITISENGSLIFEKIINKRRKGRTDEGFYECRATSRNGTVIGRQVQLTIARTSFDIEPSDQEVRLGGTARFECKVRQHNKPYIYLWEKVGSTHTLTGKRFVDFLGVLQIYNVAQEDGGQYLCRVAPISGLSDPSDSFDWRYSNAATLTVSDEVISSGELIKKETPRNLTVVEGETVVFECLMNSLPEPVITWEYSGTPSTKQILESGGTERATKRARVNGNQMFSFIGPQNLKITRVKRSDSGVYTCTGTVQGQTEKQTFTLQVLVPPIINVTGRLTYMEYPVSRRVRIPCAAKGNPKPKIKWYKDGEELAPPLKFELKSEGIIIYNAQSSAKGYYQCVAENPAGRDMATTRLFMVTPVNVPSVPRNLMAVPRSSNEIFVNWTKSSPSSPQSPVLAYTVQYSEAGATKPERVLLLVGDCIDMGLGHSCDQGQDGRHTDPEKPSMVISDLKPYTNYTFTVSAYSQTGSGRTSKSVMAATLEAVPTAAPLVTVTTETENSALVTWTEIPAEHRNGIITTYRIVYGSSKKAMMKAFEVDSSERRYILTGLDYNTEYKIRVVGGNSVGYPVLSEEMNPWLLYTTPGPPENRTFRVTPQLSFETVNDTTLIVKWEINHVTADVTSYRLTVERLIDGGLKREFNISTTDTQFVLTDLESNAVYEIAFMVLSEKIVLGVTTTEYTTAPNDPQQLPPPTDIDPVALSSNVIRIQWTEPRTVLNITHYTIKYTLMDNVSVENLTESVNESTVLDHLFPFTWYMVQIRSHTLSAFGPFSDPVPVRTKEGTPGAPKDVFVQVISPGEVQLQWDPPLEKNGVITYYIIYYTEPDFRWNSIQQNANSTSVVVKDLKHDVYFFKLRACTNAGEGQLSEIIKIVPDGCYHDCPKCYAICNKGPDPPSASESGPKMHVGILIGCGIGLVCIIACIAFVVIRHRQMRRLYDSAQTRAVPATTSTGRYHQPNGDIDEASYTPMLALKENAECDSKGGNGIIFSGHGTSIGGVIFPNGLKSSIFTNGSATACMPAEQRALLSPSSSSQGNDSANASEVQSPEMVGMETSLSGKQNTSISSVENDNSYVKIIAKPTEENTERDKSVEDNSFTSRNSCHSNYSCHSNEDQSDASSNNHYQESKNRSSLQCSSAGIKDVEVTV